MYDGDFAKGYTAGDGWWKLKNMERVVKQGQAWPFDDKRQYWWWADGCSVIFDGPAAQCAGSTKVFQVSKFDFLASSLDICTAHHNVFFSSSMLTQVSFVIIILHRK